MAPVQLKSWLEVANSFDISKRGEVALCATRQDEIGFYTQDRQTMLYPALTAPLAGKGNADLVCPRPHLDALRAFLADCQCFLVIGTSGQDEDVLGFLAECAQRIHVVHYVSDTVEVAKSVEARIAAVCPAFRKARHPAYYGNGFRWYVGDPLFQEFLIKVIELTL